MLIARGRSRVVGRDDGVPGVTRRGESVRRSLGAILT